MQARVEEKPDWAQLNRNKQKIHDNYPPQIYREQTDRQVTWMLAVC